MHSSYLMDVLMSGQMIVWKDDEIGGGKGDEHISN